MTRIINGPRGLMTEPKSRYFVLSEWEQMVNKRPEAEEYPRNWVEERWRPLVTMLDRIREAARCQITVTPNGGYRAPDHNRAVGGKRNSRHLYGDAADIRASKLTPKALHALILRLYKEGALKSLGGLGRYPGFVHVDTRPREPGQLLARWDGSKAEDQQIA